MTLLFELAAARELADPVAAFEDAERWTRHLGVIGNDPDAVAEFVREHGLRQDFDLAGRDEWLAASEIRAATDTDRHVLVGAGPEDRRLADHVGWEYRHYRDAAEKADWALAEEGGQGILARIREWLPAGVGSSGPG